MRKCLPAVCQSFPDVEERTKKLEKPTGFMTDKSILAKETDFGSWSKLADRVRKNRIISTILPALGGFACTCSCACGQPSAVSMKGSGGMLMSLKCDLTICQIVDPQVTVRAMMDENLMKK